MGKKEKNNIRNKQLVELKEKGPKPDAYRESLSFIFKRFFVTRFYPLQNCLVFPRAYEPFGFQNIEEKMGNTGKQ